MRARASFGSAVIPRRATRTLYRRHVKVQALFGASTATGSVYDFEVTDIDGKKVSLSKYKNKVLLVVNLASQCGFTPQYTELSEVFDKYSSKGFAVLGFPCNQFGKQEPGSNSQIKSFAQKKYGVKFPLFAKVDVNGSGADPLFSYLKSAKGELFGNDIKWNFSKFLVDKQGKVVARYPSTTSPKQIESDIVKYL